MEFWQSSIDNNLLTSSPIIFFFFINFQLFSPQIDWYGLQWDNFLSVFSIFSIMTQVCLPKLNQISARNGACKRNWSMWEANISSLGPRSMNSKWVLLFVLFLFYTTIQWDSLVWDPHFFVQKCSYTPMFKYKQNKF